MKINGKGCFSRRAIGFTVAGELIVELIHHPKAGRQLRAEANSRDKGMSGVMESGGKADYMAAESLKPFRQIVHRADRRFSTLKLNDLVRMGGYQADLNVHDLVPVHVEIEVEVETETTPARQRFEHRVRRCRAVVVGSNGEPNYIY